MSNIIVTIKKELRGVVRDKKSLLMMAITPLFIPIFVVLLTFIYQELTTSNQNKTYDVGFNYELTSIEKELLNKNINYHYYQNKEMLEKEYQAKKIIAYIIKDNNNYTIYSNSQSEDGSIVSLKLGSYLDNFNTYLGQKYLIDNNIDTNKVYNNITYTTNEIKGDSLFGNQIILMAVTFTIMAITLTAIYTATDSTAGEKERGTLETLLTFPIKRRELIIGKYLSICISTIITLFISIILGVLSLWYVKNNFTIYDNFVLNISTTSMTLSIIILFFYSLLISGLCISIASFTKTFKEAQSTLTPLSIVTCIPMFLEMLNIKLNGILAFIPIINHTTVINDILLGNINISDILITILTSIIYIAILIGYIIRQYKSEKILFG